MEKVVCGYKVSFQMNVSQYKVVCEQVAWPILDFMHNRIYLALRQSPLWIVSMYTADENVLFGLGTRFSAWIFIYFGLFELRC